MKLINQVSPEISPSRITPGKKFPFILLIVVIVLLSQLYVAFLPASSVLNWYSTDDAFYYFKVAQNIASGHGLTFDGINPTNGFHPLWMLVCIPIFAIANLSRILALRILIIVLVLFNAITSVYLYRLLSMFISKKAAFIGALFWALFPAIQTVSTQQGLETGLSAFFMIFFLYKTVTYQEQERLEQKWLRLGLLGLIGACVILSRLDNIFIVGTIGLWVIFGKPEIRLELAADVVAAFFCAVTACFLCLGLEGNYNRYAVVIYFAVILKPLIFSIFKLNKQPKKIFSTIFIARLVAAVITSSVVQAGMIYTISKIAVQVSFSKAIVLIDGILTLLIFGGIRFIRLRKNPVSIENPTGSIRHDWKKILQNGVVAALPIVILVGAYIAWNYFKFGILTPVSGQVKLWWATLPNTVYGHKFDAISYLGLSPNSSYGPWSVFIAISYKLTVWLVMQLPVRFEMLIPYTLLGILGIEGFLFWLISRRNEQHNWKIINCIGLLTLFFGCLLQNSYYTITSYTHTRPWYWVAQMICIVIFLSIVLDNIFQLFQRSKYTEWIQVGVSILICSIILFNFTTYMTASFPFLETVKSKNVLDDVHDLEASTEPGSIIGMTGGGNIAYFINDRTIINLDGLINSPKYFRALKTGKANDFIDEMKIEYIYGNEYMITKSDPYDDIFQGHLEKIQNTSITGNFTLYRYNPNK